MGYMPRTVFQSRTTHHNRHYPGRAYEGANTLDMVNTILEYRHPGIRPTKRFEPTGGASNLVRLRREKHPIGGPKPGRLQHGASRGAYRAKIAFNRNLVKKLPGAKNHLMPPGGGQVAPENTADRAGAHNGYPAHELSSHRDSAPISSLPMSSRKTALKAAAAPARASQPEVWPTASIASRRLKIPPPAGQEMISIIS